MRRAHFDWRRFRGERIEATVQLSPRGQFLQKNNAEFEELTGIKVGLEVVPEQQHRQKIIVEFASGRPSFDVTEISLHVKKRQVGKARWNTDIKALIADGSADRAGIRLRRLSARAVTYATQADGRHRQPAADPIICDPLLQQGALRRRRTSPIPQTLGRDGRRGEAPERSRRRASPASSAAG